jgi:hypothetical protein
MSSQSSRNYSNSKEKPPSSLLQSILTGSVAGASEVFVDHPLFVVKNFIQVGLKDANTGTVKKPSFSEVFHYFSENPKRLYQGVGANAASMIPITALQVGLNHWLKTLLLRSPEEKLSFSTQFLMAFSAGSIAAFVASPVERVITMKGNDRFQSQFSFLSVGHNILKQGGLWSLYAGLPMTMARDGTFTAFYLAVMPFLKKRMDPDNRYGLASSIVAGVGAGLAATPISQPFDVIKTGQQKNLIPQLWSQVFRDLSKTPKAAGFFSGMAPRGARVVSAVTIISAVKEKMESWMPE